MDKKTLIGSFFGIGILGILVGIIFNTRSVPSISEVITVTPPSTQKIVPTGRIVSPTIPLLSETVKKIEPQRIIIEGTHGEMTVPKNSSMVKVYRRTEGQLTPAIFDDVKVGQRVTLKIIIPGKEAELIIEK